MQIRTVTNGVHSVSDETTPGIGDVFSAQTIDRGEWQPPGATGPQGITGATGPQGFTGPQGLSYQGVPGGCTWTPVCTANVTQSTVNSQWFSCSGGATDTQGFYAVQGHTRGCYCSGKFDSINGMLGFDETPTAIGFAHLNYAMAPADGGPVGTRIFENGSQVATYGTWTTSTVFTITYDGYNVQYYCDGNLAWTTARTIGAPLYFRVNWYYTTGSNVISDTCYGPMGETGFIGSSGSQGPQGLLGPEGPSGPTGSAGLQGITGSSGVQGITGPSGPQGIRGGSDWTPVLSAYITQSVTDSGAFTRTGGNDNTEQVYSVQGYSRGCYCSVSLGDTTSYFMLGLSADPTPTSYASIQYAMVFIPPNVMHVYESGSDRGIVGAYSTSTVVGITYDGANIRYHIDGVCVYTTARAISNALLYLDTNFYEGNATVNNLCFGPMGGCKVLKQFISLDPLETVYTPTTGVTSIKVTLIGGGGGGGGAYGDDAISSAGGGGGGGSWISKEYTTIVDHYDYLIGAGGGGGAGVSDGTAGSTTTFTPDGGTEIHAHGGLGGNGCEDDAWEWKIVLGGLGGALGLGYVFYGYGSPGEPGLVLAGTTGVMAGGNGGSSSFGGGGLGATSNADGGAGMFFGGGGGGAATTGNVTRTRTGGDGQLGAIFIEEYF